MKQGRILLLLLTIASQSALCWAGKQYLNEYIHHYESINYNTESLHNSHIRAKRSIDSQVNLQFFAHGRDFHLRLRRDTNTFSRDAHLQDSDGRLAYLDVSHIYEGHVVKEPDSYVHGSIIQGIFAGTIRTRRATYYVDKTEVYFRKPQAFHSVIYSEDDMIIDPYRRKRHAHRGACGNTDVKTREWMESVQNTATVKERVEKRDVEPEARERQQERGNMYTATMNRVKREQPQKTWDLTCNMFLQSDPKLWDYMTGKRGDGGLEYDDARATEEITSLLSTHARGIKLIYETTKFKYKDLSYNPVKFVVHRMQVNNTKKMCAGHINPPFCQDHIDESNFLDLHSMTDHSDFCLSYVFTYRDFPSGVIGMAWVATPTGTAGVCDKYKKYTEKLSKNYNTGFITLHNYGKRVPLRVTTLTFAHEVGHSFGSPHDKGKECTPYSYQPRDLKGNYIMFESATSGQMENNDKFSPCSIGNITLVIDAVVHGKGGKKNCFMASDDPFCGNKIVEEGEQCDCGYDDADCGPYELKCCSARNDSSNGCKLKPSADCSPTKGPCCNSNCKLVKSGLNQTCAEETECSYSVTCNGTSELCPAATAKEDNFPCNSDTQLCLKGVCSSSICNKIGVNGTGWEQCYITAQGGKNVDRSTMCYVACTNPETKACVSSANKDAIADPKNKQFKELLKELKKENIQLQPGAPCDNFRGFCDFFQKCRDVESDGPLARIKHLLLNQDNLKDWVITYWWAVVLMVLGVVVFMGLLLKICELHIPSTNPNRKPCRKLALPQAIRLRSRGMAPNDNTI